MRTLLWSLGLGVPLALVTVAGASAQATIADCEKIQAADAYNQCLAKFGPSGKNLNMEPEKPGDIKNSGEEAAATAAKLPRAGRHASGRRHGASRHASGGGGRKRMSFTVKRRKK